MLQWVDVSSRWALVIFTLEFAAKLAMVSFILLRRNRRAHTNLAWIVVIFAIPWLGTIAYLLFGEVRLGARRIRRHAEIVQLVMQHANEQFEPRSLQPAIDPRFAHLAVLAESSGSFAPKRGNSLRLFGDTGAFVNALIADIDAARAHCHLLFYIYLPDHTGRRVADALIRAAQRGVHCRLLIDSVGSKLLWRSHIHRDLRSAGVEVVEAMPVQAWRIAFARIDLRNHRKIAVIDGRIGYTGSQNIADAAFAIKPKFAPWVDMMVRLEGPAVRDLQLLFVEDWYLDTDQSLHDVLGQRVDAHQDDMAVHLIGTGPNAFNEALHHLMQALFHAAREELILTTPYFVPDDPTLESLECAAQRGVETTLILPARNDSPLVAAASRSHYRDLLDAGVHIHEFHAGLLHAKTVTIDRALALVSTANLDRRSFELNFEVSMLVYDDDFASELRALQKSYLNDAEELMQEAWERRPRRSRLWQNAMGTLSPLL